MTDFNSAQYKKVIAACNERSEIPTMDWIPDKEECVHTQLHEADQHKIDLTQDSEYLRLFEQQTELIEKWVEEEEKRLPPMPPKSPYEANE